jgi:hypothetical protein
MGSKQQRYCIQHNVTRWRAGTGRRGAGFSVLEQCATLHLPVLDFHMIALYEARLCATVAQVAAAVMVRSP